MVKKTFTKIHEWELFTLTAWEKGFNVNKNILLFF